VHRERTQYNNIILRPSGGGPLRELTSYVCVHIICYIYMCVYRGIRTHTLCRTQRAHTSVVGVICESRDERGVGIFSPRHTFTFCFSFRFVRFFCETVKSRYPGPERLTYTGAITGLAHIAIVYLYNIIYMSYLPPIMVQPRPAASPRNTISSAFCRAV